MARGYLVKRNGVYYARYRDEHDIERKRSLKTTNKEIAQAKLSAFIEKIEKREIDWEVKDKLIDQYLTEYLSYCKAEHTAKVCRDKKRVLRILSRR